MLARVRRSPVQIEVDGESYLVTYQFAVDATLGLLYSTFAAPFLGELLQTIYAATGKPALQRPEPTGLGDRGFQPARQGVPADEPYFGLEWFRAVECTDSLNPSNPWLWPRYARRADRESASPFGSAWVYGSLACATWPATDPDRYMGPWNRRTANPILLIGNRRGDPATPYEDAVSTSKLLASARLLTLDSFGHTAQGGLSRCIDDAVDRYMIERQLPPAGLVCQPDRRPFDPLPEIAARRRGASALPPSPITPRG